MSEIQGEECGVIVTHSFKDCYTGLQSLQHRGQEAAGMAKKAGQKIDVVKWLGRVTDFSDHYLENILGTNNENGAIFVGHVRYSTSGDKRSVENAHPHFIGGRVTSYRNHIIARDVDIAVVHNGTLVRTEFDHPADCDTMNLLHLYQEFGPAGIIERVPAAYSAIIMDSKDEKVSIIRDRHGMRPLAIGEKNGKFIAASEDRAIYKIDGATEGELRPGSIAYVTPDEFSFQDVIINAPRRACFFEGNYLAHWKSRLNGQSVKVIRRRLGQNAAKEFAPDDITMVTYVPKAPFSVAMGYAMELGLKPTEVFYKITLDRSFIEPDQQSRQDLISKNLYVRDDVDLRGHVIVIVDDSIVRGIVIKDAVKKCKERGAKKVYFVSVTPPLGPVVDGVPRGCLYGVDTPPLDDFVWRRFNGDMERIEAYSGADKIYYLSERGMFAAYDMPRENFCTYCIGGPDPLK